MANAVEARRQNLRSVLRAVQQTPGISKPALCRQCALTASTVQNIVGALVRTGAVQAVGEAHSTGGRRALCYRIDPAHKVAVAVSICHGRVDVGLLDMGLDMLARRSRPTPLRTESLESYVADIAADIAALLDEAAIPPSKLVGVGVCVPGPVDSETGTIHQLAGAPMWADYPLGARLAAATGLPVFVDKDNFSALSLLRYTGRVDSSRTAAFLSVGEGVGAAVMIGGEIFRGSHALAGEVGHVTVRRDGVRCACGNIGCLELYCSDAGLLNQYNTQTQALCADIDALMQSAESGDETAQRLFVQAVRYLVETAAGIILNYDPDELVIHCRWLARQPSLYTGLLDGLYAKSVFTQKHTVAMHLLGEEDILLPAAGAMVCEQYLFGKNSPLMQQLER